MIYIFEGDDLDAINKNLDEIKKGFEKGLIDLVYVDETRPLLQGSRLTAWARISWR
mgnify:CR=1 FL=1